MSERNRVTPRSEIIATPARGMFMGNRGHLHHGHEIVRPYNGRLWIICALEFRGRHQIQWHPRHYTVLFFADEAVGLAAGHRPCGECRRAAYNAFRSAWTTVTGDVPDAKAMNDRLHADRLDGRTQRTHRAAWASLPDGTFALADDRPVLVVGDAIVPWEPAGYATPRRRPTGGDATVLTPRITVEALRAGYEPVLGPIPGLPDIGSAPTP